MKIYCRNPNEILINDIQKSIMDIYFKLCMIKEINRRDIFIEGFVLKANTFIEIDL